MNISKTFQRLSIGLVLLSTLIVSCNKNFITEYNPGNRTTDNFYNTVAGFTNLVNSCYPLLRDMTQRKKLTHNSTDIFAENGFGGLLYSLANQQGSARDSYDLRFNSTDGEVQSYWDQLYREINRCNAAITREKSIVGGDATVIANLV